MCGTTFRPKQLAALQMPNASQFGIFQLDDCLKNGNLGLWAREMFKAIVQRQSGSIPVGRGSEGSTEELGKFAPHHTPGLFGETLFSASTISNLEYTRSSDHTLCLHLESRCRHLMIIRRNNLAAPYLYSPKNSYNENGPKIARAKDKPGRR
jgi:hypothetical protein